MGEVCVIKVRKERKWGGGEFKKRIITLKKSCFIPHQQKGMFHLQRPKGLSAPLSLDFMKKIEKKNGFFKKKKIEESNNEITLGGGEKRKALLKSRLHYKTGN